MYYITLISPDIDNKILTCRYITAISYITLRESLMAHCLMIRTGESDVVSVSYLTERQLTNMCSLVILSWQQSAMLIHRLHALHHHSSKSHTRTVSCLVIKNKITCLHDVYIACLVII